MKKKLQIAAGCAIGVFLFWYLFRDTDWSEVWRTLKSAHMGWLLLSLLVILLGFFIRVWRWGYIVNPVTPTPFWRLFSATQIGFLGNFVLPARVGEVIRALALSRSQKMPLPKTMAFVAVDRITDLFGLIAVFLVTLAVFHPEQDVYLPEELRGLYGGPISQGMIRGALFSMTGVLAVGAAIMMVLILRKQWFLSLSDAVLGRVSTRLASLAHTIFDHFTEGMQVLTHGVDLAKASGVSLLLWGSFALSHVFVYKAFAIDVPWYTPFVMLSLLSVFISIPGPPGFVGPFHAGVVGGLILVNPEINLNIARAIALFAHLFNLVPIVIVGAICLSFERLELRSLSRESEVVGKGVSSEE